MALSTVFWSGCASDRVVYSPAAVAANSPAAQIVGPLELYPVATKYVAEHPGTDFMVGSGDSMRPLYKDHTVIITEQLPISGLRPGMTVVFVGDSGFPVAHVLIRKTTDGWMAKGVSNLKCDARRVNDDNYMTVVVRAYEPTSSPLLALIRNQAIHSKDVAFAFNP
jgi:hypothetical protein